MFKQTLADIGFDILGEMFAVTLLLNGGNPSDPDGEFVFRPLGKLHTGVMKDIIAVNQEEDESDQPGNKIDVMLRSTGLVGNLPEMLYTKPVPDPVSDAEKAREYQEQLKNTLRFFQPFDHVLFQPKVRTSLWEVLAPFQILNALLEMPEWEPLLRQFVLRRGENEYELLESAIRETDGAAVVNRKKEARYCLQKTRSLLKMGMLLSDRICGDFERTEAYFEELIGQPVKIEEDPDFVHKIPNHQQFRIGKARLGEDTVLGSEFAEGIPALVIQIGEVTLDKIESYLPHGASRNVLERILYYHFLPSEVHWETRIVPKEQVHHFTLGNENRNAILGYTTQVCSSGSYPEG